MLHNNNFYGTFPDLTAQRALTYLGLSTNRFLGTIPAHLSALTALKFLDIHDNLLFGRVPALPRLAELESFDASNNQLYGTVPSVATATYPPSAAVWSNNCITGASSYTGCVTPSGLADRTTLVELFASLDGPMWTNRRVTRTATASVLVLNLMLPLPVPVASQPCQ